MRENIVENIISLYQKLIQELVDQLRSQDFLGKLEVGGPDK